MKEVMRVHKVKSGGVRGIQRENNRTEADKGSFPLSKIDWSRTGENEILIECKDWNRGFREMLKKCSIPSCRKDAVRLLDVVYTASPGFFETAAAEVQDEYFRRCLAFHEKHYGVPLNAVVHRDETTPHLHVVSVPLVRHEDGTFSLSAKGLLGGCQDFRRRVTAFHVEVGKDFDLERGESRDPADKRRHVDTYTHDVESLRAEAEALRGEIWHLEGQRDKVAADLGDKVTLQGLASWAESIRDRICDLVSGIRDWLEQLLGKIESRVVLIRDDLEKASCRMRGIKTADGERFKFPATKDGEPLTWQGKSPLYVEDGLRYIPAMYSLKDKSLEYADPADFSRDSRDPAAADFMDRLEDVSAQLDDLAEALEKAAPAEADPVDKERD